MTRLIVEAVWYLLRTEWPMRKGGFPALHCLLRRSSSWSNRKSPYQEGQICRAMDVACVLYFKRVLCLQRSIATTMLLRHHGLFAELVIGAQILPFKSHAWVELHGQVINDKSYTPQIYRELERC
jgi:prolyl oligopeptidase